MRFLFCLLFTLSFGGALSAQAQKKVLLEKFSSAICGTCPGANLLIDDLHEDHPELITVIHHSGFWSDSMTVEESLFLAQEFAIGTPSGMVDRRGFGSSNISTTTSAWKPRIELMSDTPGHVNIDITPLYDSVSRNTSVTVNLEWESAPQPGDIRLHVYLIEDSLTGTGWGWDQQNYYSFQHSAQGGTNHPLYNLPHPIPGYVHNRVVRNFLAGFWGTPGLFVESPQPGQSASETYTLTLPDHYRPLNMQVVAFVAYHDEDNRQNRFVINAESAPLWDGETGFPAEILADNYSLFPNPSPGHLSLRSELLSPRQLTAELYTLTGKLAASYSFNMSSGMSDTSIPLPSLTNGVYLLRLDDGIHSEVRKVAIAIP